MHGSALDSTHCKLYGCWVSAGLVDTDLAKDLVTRVQGMVGKETAAAFTVRVPEFVVRHHAAFAVLACCTPTVWQSTSAGASSTSTPLRAET